MTEERIASLLIKMKDGNEFIVDDFEEMNDMNSCGMIVFSDNQGVNELWIPRDQILYIMSMHGRCTYADHIVSK